MNTPAHSAVKAHAPPPVFQFRPESDPGPTAEPEQWDVVKYKEPGQIGRRLVCVNGFKLFDRKGAAQYPEMFRHPCFYYTQRAWLYLWSKRYWESRAKSVVLWRGIVVRADCEDSQRLAALAFRHQVLAVPNF